MKFLATPLKVAVKDYDDSEFAEPQITESIKATEANNAK